MSDRELRDQGRRDLRIVALPEGGGIVAYCLACHYCWLAARVGMTVEKTVKLVLAMSAHCPNCGDDRGVGVCPDDHAARAIRLVFSGPPVTIAPEDVAPPEGGRS